MKFQDDGSSIASGIANYRVSAERRRRSIAVPEHQNNFPSPQCLKVDDMLRCSIVAERGDVMFRAENLATVVFGEVGWRHGCVALRARR